MSERNDPTSDSVSQGFKKQRTDTMVNTVVEADTPYPAERLSELPMDIFSEVWSSARGPDGFEPSDFDRLRAGYIPGSCYAWHGRPNYFDRS